jgi:hypothetical protein
METYTSGPWKIQMAVYHDKQCYYIGQGKESGEQALVNANLIAAAPDLLEALKVAFSRLGSLYPDGDVPKTEMDFIESAINKAEGAK